MTFDFDEQLAIGEEGVEVVKTLYSDVEVKDYAENMAVQRRGIDLWVDGEGWVEVKTDRHESENIFVEYSKDGQPGGLWCTRADVLMVVFPKLKLIFRCDVSELQFWVAKHYTLLTNSQMSRTVTSRRGAARWSVEGFIVSRAALLAELESAEEVSY